MEKFRYLPHTGDMQFRAQGKTFSRAVENAALALLNIMLDIKRVKKARGGKVFITIKEAADDRQELVWFTLQDILSKVDSKQLSAFSFEVVSLKENERLRLTGRLHCKKTKENCALFSVKAVTPHDLTVEKGRGVWSIHVVVDV